MNKLFKTLAACFMLLFPVMGYAQSYEPEFIGECNLLSINGTDTTSIATHKTKAYIKAKAGASLYLVGIGSVKTRITMEGKTSKCVVPVDTKQAIVVRVANNDIDPNSFIEIIKFEVKGNQRRSEIAKSNTFGGVSKGNMSSIEYRAKRYGEKSFILSFTPEKGEYAVRITNPDHQDEKVLMLYCFSEVEKEQ